MSPYIITTVTPHVWQDMPSEFNPSGIAEATETHRRAVPTLDEARHHVMVVGWDHGEQYVSPDTVPIAESGGTIGPLPDGTTIEVKPITRLELIHDLLTGPSPDYLEWPLRSTEELVAAWNEPAR